MDRTELLTLVHRIKRSTTNRDMLTICEECERLQNELDGRGPVAINEVQYNKAPRKRRTAVKA